jgi:sulfur carrier protein
MNDTPRTTSHVIANGQSLSVTLPATIESFLVQRGLPPRSVVVELNGQAVVPSEFGQRRIQAGDRLEIVRIVAGG